MTSKGTSNHMYYHKYQFEYFYEEIKISRSENDYEFLGLIGHQSKQPHNKTMLQQVFRIQKGNQPIQMMDNSSVTQPRNTNKKVKVCLEGMWTE